MSSFITKTSRRDNPYLATEPGWIRVERDGYSVDRSTFGARTVGKFADDLTRRLQCIDEAFTKSKAIVTQSTNVINAKVFNRWLDDVHGLWVTKGTRWRDAFKKADYTIRKLRIPKEARDDIRAALFKSGIQDLWVLEPGTAKSRKRLAEDLGIVGKRRKPIGTVVSNEKAEEQRQRLAASALKVRKAFTGRTP